MRSSKSLEEAVSNGYWIPTDGSFFGFGWVDFADYPPESRLWYNAQSRIAIVRTNDPLMAWLSFQELR